MKSTIISVTIAAIFVTVLIRLNNGATPDSTLGKVFGKK